MTLIRLQPKNIGEDYYSVTDWILELIETHLIASSCVRDIPGSTQTDWLEFLDSRHPGQLRR
ncbi:hypothetical protein [Deinococcus aerophilus]|uniref:Uncharacterized protein n=1 Tax=Deinococcus aerophilus TaxID=522488 RepID=A0ABQ2GS59_9DEIO|nr:hypothetical protein [Deinococcus aerophilus]GGM08767.1 hypothetical protein GCM10010841_16390 [Deinococcus aerophilus]